MITHAKYVCSELCVCVCYHHSLSRLVILEWHVIWKMRVTIYLVVGKFLLDGVLQKYVYYISRASLITGQINVSGIVLIFRVVNSILEWGSCTESLPNDANNYYIPH